VTLLSALILGCLINACAHRPPDLIPCSIVNVDVAQCTPTNPLEPVHDKTIPELLGYTCHSPEDIGSLKVWAKKVLEEINGYLK